MATVDRDNYKLDSWCFHVKDAARDGRTQYVLEQLVRHDLKDTACNILLTCCAAGSIRSDHVDLARALLDRGADPNLRGRALTPLNYAARGLGDASVDMVALLLDAGGAIRTSLSHSLPLVYRGFEASDSARHLRCRRITRLLLRAGMPPHTGYYLEALWNDFRIRNDWATEEHFLATKKLILDVRAAGSPQAYRMLRRKQVLLLRSLALRGRAKPRDARMKFLVESPNEIAWKVLEYWRTELDC